MRRLAKEIPELLSDLYWVEEDLFKAVVELEDEWAEAINPNLLSYFKELSNRITKVRMDLDKKLESKAASMNWLKKAQEGLDSTQVDIYMANRDMVEVWPKGECPEKGCQTVTFLNDLNTIRTVLTGPGDDYFVLQNEDQYPDLWKLVPKSEVTNEERVELDGEMWGVYPLDILEWHEEDEEFDDEELTEEEIQQLHAEADSVSLEGIDQQVLQDIWKNKPAHNLELLDYGFTKEDLIKLFISNWNQYHKESFSDYIERNKGLYT
jgi:hypothetical protein